ncbi:MAG: DUF268 domain-containing protein [Clostridia bacterium]|nr:DUF268 domain-containing protein [Clostridia bacterium]
MRILKKIFNKLLSMIKARYKNYKIKERYLLYCSMMKEDHPFKNFSKIKLGDCSADPKEFFNHYEAYAFWLGEKVLKMGSGKKILDIGNKKITNAMLSLNNEVYSLVLTDCEDRISNVKYTFHDVTKKLPFEDKTFDVFTSAVSLQLIGLARYGDELDPYALINLFKELDRTMKDRADLIFSITFGPNCLVFNNHWIFDIDTLKKLFSGWELIDYLVDNRYVENIEPKPNSERFSKDLDIKGLQYGDYKVIFLHFRRGY